MAGTNLTASTVKALLQVITPLTTNQYAQTLSQLLIQDVQNTGSLFLALSSSCRPLISV